MNQKLYEVLSGVLGGLFLMGFVVSLVLTYKSDYWVYPMVTFGLILIYGTITIVQELTKKE